MSVAHIRWDRVSRCALLGVLGVLVFLYVNPLTSYVHTLREAHRRSAAVSALARENARLRATRRALDDPHVVESQARRLGMLRPGERGYVVRGLPKGP